MSTEKLLMLNQISKVIFCVLVLLAVQVAAAQDQSSQTTASPSPEARQNALDRLTNALTDLIPGDYQPDSENLKGITKVVESFTSGNEEATNEALDQLAKLDPNLPPRELLLAGLAYASNNSNGGRAMLEQAGVRHRRHPGVALAFSRLALLQNRYFEALACAETAQKINTASDLAPIVKSFYEIECLDALTATELRRGELEPAKRFALQWEKLAPGSDKMMMANGEIKFLQDDIPASLSYLNRRSEQLKTNTPTEIIIAKWYQNKNGADENYVKWIEDAYKKWPNNSLTQIEYAAWLIRSEKFEETKAVVAAYEKIKNETPRSKLIKGRIAFAEDDYQTAETNFFELLRAQPNNFEHAYFLILSLVQSGDEAKQKQALQLAQRTYQSFPNQQLSAAVAGWTFYQTGNKQVGVQLLGQASNIGQLLPDTAYFLAQVLSDQQQATQAKTTLEPFIDSKAVFVFRRQAKELMQTLNSADALPKPDDK